MSAIKLYRNKKREAEFNFRRIYPSPPLYKFLDRPVPSLKPDIVPVSVSFPAKLHRTITVEELLEEGGAGKPQP